MTKNRYKQISLRGKKLQILIKLVFCVGVAVVVVVLASKINSV